MDTMETTENDVVPMPGQVWHRLPSLKAEEEEEATYSTPAR